MEIYSILIFLLSCNLPFFLYNKIDTYKIFIIFASIELFFSIMTEKHLYVNEELNTQKKVPRQFSEFFVNYICKYDLLIFILFYKI